MTDDDLIVRYKADELIGFTVLRAGKHNKKTGMTCQTSFFARSILLSFVYPESM